MTFRRTERYLGAALLTAAVSVATIVLTNHSLPAAGGKAPVRAGDGHATSSQPLGSWTAPAQMASGTAPAMIAVHSALLNTGKVLFFGIYPSGDNGGNPPPYNPAVLYDPVANTITEVPQNIPIAGQGFMTCAGESILPDGRLFVTGGIELPMTGNGRGIANTYFFSPTTQTWSQGPNMQVPRWYPTNVPMPDGTVLILSGHDANANEIVQSETYNPVTNTTTLLPTSANDPDTSRSYTYPRMEVLPSGLLFKAAQAAATYTYNPATESWTFVANTNFGDRFFTGHVLLPNSSTVMVVGGSPTNVGGGTTPTATTETIDLSQPTPAWVYGPSMNIARYNAALEWLADGTIIAVGGGAGPGHYGAPIYQPEIYNPATQTWTVMAAQQGLRDYHSAADLLPDGRVISAGSTSGDPTQTTYEIFSPPYLSQGTRPTITKAPKAIAYGQAFGVGTPNASSIVSVALILASTSTHTDDMNQRYVPLTFAIKAGNLAVTAPANANIAPPGYYMLSIVNSSGVPAVMPFVQVHQ